MAGKIMSSEKKKKQEKKHNKSKMETKAKSKEKQGGTTAVKEKANGGDNSGNDETETPKYSIENKASNNVGEKDEEDKKKNDNNKKGKKDQTKSPAIKKPKDLKFRKTPAQRIEARIKREAMAKKEKDDPDRNLTKKEKKRLTKKEVNLRVAVIKQKKGVGHMVAFTKLRDM